MAIADYIITRITWVVLLCIVWLSINGHLQAQGQTVKTTTSVPVKTTTSVPVKPTTALPVQTTTPENRNRPVNLIVINEAKNRIAAKSVADSLKQLTVNNPGLLGNVTTINIDGVAPQEDLKRICKVWNRAVTGDSVNVPDFVLDTTRSGYAGETVSSFTASLGIPTLSAQYGQVGDMKNWQQLDKEQVGYLVQVMPPTDVIPEAARTLTYQMNITNAGIIFDDTYVMDHKYKSLFLNVQTRHILIGMKPTANEIRRLLRQFRELDIVNYFILGDEKTVKSVLDVGQSMNFTGRRYGWYVLTQDDFEPRCECKNVTLIMFKPVVTATIQQRLTNLTTRGLLMKPLITSAYYYDLARLGVLAMKASIKDRKWPVQPKHITCDAFNGKNRPSRKFNYLENLAAISNNEGAFQPTFATFRWDKSNGLHRPKFVMTAKMVNIVNGNPISSEDLGTWSAKRDNYFEVKSDEVVRNHTAVTSYRIVTVVKEPFVMYDEKTKKWSGYCIELIEDLAAYLNFTYDLREVEDKKFGMMNKNGTWSGMIKELQEKRADIALGALSVMAERENVVDFTVPYYDLVGIAILMHKAKPETSLFKFLTVLENNVWLCILGSYFFTSFLMWLFDRWSPYSFQNNREKFKDDDEKREFTLRECLWFCMTSLTPQGGGEAPKNLSGRLVAATWWLFGFIIIASYTANLAAFLTVSRLEEPIESLDDLRKQYKVQYAPIVDSEAYTYFYRMSRIEERFYDIWRDMSLNDSLSNEDRAKLAVWDYPVSDKYTKMFQAMAETRFPADMQEAMLRVRRQHPNMTNHFALIGDATDIRFLAMTNCDLLMVGSEFSRKPYALAVQQGSPLKEPLNNAILHLLNLRRLEKLKSKWWDRNPKRVRCEKVEEESEGISIANIGGVFIVIFVGIILACSVLVFEYYWYRYRPKRKEAALRKAAIKKGAKNSSPMRFKLKPAITAFEPNQLRSRF